MLHPVLRQRLITQIREKTHPVEPIGTHRAPVLPSLPHIRCVAFDVYGTLLVSAAGEIATASELSTDSNPFVSVAHLIGLPEEYSETLSTSYHETIRAYHHRAHRAGVDHPEVDVRSIWTDVMAACGASQTREPEEVALTYELAANPVWPMPGARPVLESLAANGIRTALVSNAQFYTPLILEELLHTTLDALRIRPRIWSYEIGAAKPSSTPFRALQKSLSQEGIHSGQTLYVGNDMLNDVVAAQNEGFAAILFAGDARSLRERSELPEIRKCTPDGVITDLMQLPALIDSR